MSSEDKGNRNLNGAGLWPSLPGGFNDGHFAGEMTREKLGRLDWRTRLRSKWSDLNYMYAPRVVALLEFVPHLQICICIGPHSYTCAHTDPCSMHVHSLAHAGKKNIITFRNIRAAL